MNNFLTLHVQTSEAGTQWDQATLIWHPNFDGLIKPILGKCIEAPSPNLPTHLCSLLDLLLSSLPLHPSLWRPLQVSVRRLQGQEAELESS